MKSCFISKAARTDLLEIWNYLADKNLDAADQVLEDIHSAFNLLSDSPQLGHLRVDLSQSQVRFWPVRGYLIVYQDNSPVEIVRVLSGFRDIENLLK